MGALGASLGTMVADLSSHKRGWDKRWKEFSDWAEKGKELQGELVRLVDEDTNAFNSLLAAFKLPSKSDKEKKEKQKAVELATKNAILAPFKVMETSYKAFKLLKAMVETGNPNSLSDAGVGAIAIRGAIMGAYLNVKINSGDLKDQKFKKEIIAKCETLVEKTKEKEQEILAIVNNKI
jgi:glutamate formiminotransferase/formiminotetrahydrofolate cyclodeaminase